MFSKKKSVAKPSSPNTKKIRVSGSNDSNESNLKRDATSTTLGLCDVIYENVTAEEKPRENGSGHNGVSKTEALDEDSSFVSVPFGNNSEKQSKFPPRPSALPLDTMLIDREISKASKTATTKVSNSFFGLNLNRRNSSKKFTPKPAEPSALPFGNIQTIQKENSDGAISISSRDSGVVSDSSTSQRKRPSPPVTAKFSSKKKKSDTKNTTKPQNSGKISRDGTVPTAYLASRVSEGSQKKVPNSRKSKGNLGPKVNQKGAKPSPRPSRRESTTYLLSDSPESTSATYDTLPGQSSHVEESEISVPIPDNLSVSNSSSRSTRNHATGGRKSLLCPEEIWLSSVESRLVDVADGKPTLTLPQFKDIMQVKESFFIDRCFQLFDRDSDGQLQTTEFINELRALVLGSKTDKLRFLFNLYNIRGTGKLVKSEIEQMLKSCMEESKLKFSPENLKALTDAFVAAADTTRDGRITFDEMRALVERHPTIAENLNISDLMTATTTGFEFEAQEFPPIAPEVKTTGSCRHLSQTYIQNNLKKIVFLLVFFLINAGLGAFNGWRYRGENGWIILARINGLPLNFNCTMIVVLMLRRLLTAVRATALVKFLPIDQNIMFHKLCGYLILVQSIAHTIGHIGNAGSISTRQMSAAEVIFTTKAGYGWVANTAPPTGVALVVVLTVMILLSLPCVRNSGCFEVFYWSHKLYLLFWPLLIIHSETFWMWFLVPGLFFLIETVSRISWVRSVYQGRTYIQAVSLLPSEVTHLNISRPPGFSFRPGDYVYVKIPQISKHEWHPFTISSAPEQQDGFSLHIRCAGSWTKSLREFFDKYQLEDVEAGASNSCRLSVPEPLIIRRRASSIAWGKRRPLKAREIDENIRKRTVTKAANVLCHIDGPYGTPSRHIFESEHAVLIGSGIGITPFASILQSIVHRFKASYARCPKCDYHWCHSTPASVMNLKKVDFVWINRDQRHFEWFVSLLSRLEREQEVDGGIGHILDMHMYMTSAPPKTDMKGLGLQLALDLIHQNEKFDLVTGLQTRTQAGRPDFDLLFKRIQENAKGKVTVFFCGSPLLGKTLKEFSHQYGFAFRHEYF